MKTLPIFLSILVLALSSCGDDDAVAPEPTVEISSPITSIAESSVYEGAAGDVVEFTVTAEAPAGFKSFYIELFQRHSSGQRVHQLVLLESGSPEVSGNKVNYTFSRELEADDFTFDENFIRAVITDVKDRSATRGFRLEKN